jgi:RNA-splicing ligase RtcB
MLRSEPVVNDTNPTQIHVTGEATGFIPAPGDKGKPITVIGTNSIRAGFDATCLQQALNARSAPGVTDLVLNPDAHAGFLEKTSQLGSYGGGNHFGECEVVHLADNDRARRTAEVFGLREGCVGFLSHCGSRGFGHALASGQFRALQHKFATWDIPLPGGDKELVYAPLGTPESQSPNYLMREVDARR